MRTSKRQIVMLSSLAICATLGHVPLAHAYLDPGTGSMMLQAVIGAIAGAAVVGRLYWYKIKGLFRRRRETAESTDSLGRRS